MNYLAYKYHVRMSQAAVFDRVLDLKLLQEKIDLFAGCDMQSDSRSADQIGKSYVLSANVDGDELETTITLEQIDTPNLAVFGYSYRYLNPQSRSGEVFPPWESLTCKISFRAIDGGTLVETKMLANGVDNAWKRVYTRILSVVNFFQQRKLNGKVAKFLESEA